MNYHKIWLIIISIFLCIFFTASGAESAKKPLADVLRQSTGAKKTLADVLRQSSGDFILTFSEPKKDVYRDIKTIFSKSGEFNDIVDSMNQRFSLPYDIKIDFIAGDGPVYYPSRHTIQMSYDFIFYLAVLYLERYPKAKDDEMIGFALRTNTFLLYHEIAHALIDAYRLPIVSNEETAADNLAVILALEYRKDGLHVVMNSAELFDLMEKDKPKKYEESDYWDEHALDAQRFYNILCLAYGKYPKEVKAQLNDMDNKNLLKFIKERGDYCIDDYQRQLDSWSTLLESHLKQ